MSEPPDEIQDYALACRDLLGLDTWDIVIRMVDTTSQDDATKYGTSAAACRFQECYQIATIELVRGREPDEYRLSVMHEMLHLALAPLDRMGDLVAAMLPPRQEQAAALMLGEACERVITPLAKALVKGIKPTGKVE